MAQTEKSFFERNKNAILIGGIVLIVIIGIVPDIYIRKYVPWVK